MRKLLTIIVLVLMFSCVNRENKESKNVTIIGDFSLYEGMDTTKTIFIDRYLIDLNFDSIPDTIILENLKSLVGDPQIYTIIRIKLYNQKEFVFKNVGGYTQDLKTIKEFPNRINSDKIYIPDFRNDESYLIFWDWQYPNCEAEVCVLKVAEDKIKKVFKENFYVSEINDFNHDGKIDFKGKSTCDENEPVKVVEIE